MLHGDPKSDDSDKPFKAASEKGHLIVLEYIAAYTPQHIERLCKANIRNCHETVSLYL